MADLTEDLAGLTDAIRTLARAAASKSGKLVDVELID